MKKKTLLLIVVSLNGLCLVAQSPSVKIRQSFQSAESKPEPAIVTYTNPKGKENSYLIDAALGISLPADSRQTFFGYVEYHRNTLVDEESNTVQAGAAYEIYTNKHFLVGMNPKIHGSTSIITGNVKYSDNRVKKVESIQLSGEFTRLYAPGLVRGFVPNAWHRVGSQLAIEYFPSVGLEYEGRFKTEEEALKGHIVRAMGKLNISIYPLASLLNNDAELFFNSAYRYDVINSTVDADRSHPSIEIGVNYVVYSDGNRKIALGASYNNIDEPALGKEKQNFWMVALKVKI